jgi:CRISPR-associated protein Csb2
MTVIELTFPAGGRLHATPWGRHVNEGATEWPISPWRIQRALVATWYLKARDEIEEAVMRSLMDALASAAPGFGLPAAVQSHTRHYMPGRGTDKPKVFDTFVQSSQPVRIAWDIILDEAQRSALSILCERLGYLGRAESIVEATLLTETAGIKINSHPLPEGDDIPAGSELVRVLCASAPQTHTTWLAANQPKELAPAKAAKSKTKSKAPSLPTTIFDALHAETATLQSQGWLIPPGSRWVDYVREIECFEPASSRPRRNTGKPVTVARFAISSTVLPRLTQTLSVAERLHQTLAKRADGKACASIFTGKGTDGLPMSEHRHTHIFCELGEKRDSLGYITLYAPDGFNHEAQQVIEDIQRKALWGHGGHDLDLILLGLGGVPDFDIPVFGKSKHWTSLTPFVPTRHAKHYADGRPKLDADGWPVGTPAQDLRRLIQQERGILPKTISLPRTDITVGPGRTLRTLQFQTERSHGDGRRGHQSGVGLTIEFAEEITGPLALGYGSHFGLGLFVPL